MTTKGEKFLVWSPEMEAEAVKDLLKEKVILDKEIWWKPLLTNFKEKEENNYAFCIKCGLLTKCVNYSVYPDFEDIPFMVFYLETIQKHIGEEDRLTFIYHLILISGRKWEDEYDLQYCINEKIEEEGIGALRDFLEDEGNWIKCFGIDFSKKELEKD